MEHRPAAATRVEQSCLGCTAEAEQAANVLVLLLDVSAQEALSWLDAYAVATNRPLIDVAHDVITRRLVVPEIDRVVAYPVGLGSR